MGVENSIWVPSNCLNVVSARLVGYYIDTQQCLLAVYTSNCDDRENCHKFLMKEIIEW